jgi:hypothetical protein
VEPPAIIDQQGQEQDWAWLSDSFGDVAIERAGAAEGHAHVYRVIRLRDTLGPAAQVVKVLDQAGLPLEGIRVVRHWPDAPELTGLVSPASVWRERGVRGPTNANGEIGFGMGKEDYYAAASEGPAAVWVAEQAGPSDLISGLGMLELTNHRHLDIVFQREKALSQAEATPSTSSAEQEVAVPPAPSPMVDEQWDRIFEKLDLIIDVLEERVGEEQIGKIAT